MPGSYSPESLGSSPFWKTYTDFTNDIDLIADGGGPCRAIRNAGAAADVASVTAGGGGVSVTVSLIAGALDRVQAVKILKTSSGTTATKVTVYW